MGGQNNIFWAKYFLGWSKNISEKIIYSQLMKKYFLKKYIFSKNIFSSTENILFFEKYFFGKRENIFQNIIFFQKPRIYFWKNSIFSKVVKIFFGIFLFFRSQSSADKRVRVHVQVFHFIYVQALFWYLRIRKIQKIPSLKIYFLGHISIILETYVNLETPLFTSKHHFSPKNEWNLYR